MIAHPPWCSAEECTANPAAASLETYRDLGSVRSGEHRSAPLTLDLTGASDALGWLLNGAAVTASLTRAMAPWPTSTYLRISVNGAELAIPADRARGLLDQLAEFVAAADYDGEAGR